ncbi:MAG: response regulator [Oligoflexia bacterium]|nr:response regulator [Oligoflexia bacterium]
MITSLHAYIIDDEKDVLEVVELMLEEHFDCKVKKFTSIAQAIKSLKKEKVVPDIIISDVKIPNENGLALKNILEENTIPNIPIIFITGLNGDDIIEEDLVMLSKPINKNTLYREIHRLIKK